MTLEANNLTISYTGTLPRVPFVAIRDKILGTSYELSIAFVSPKTAQKINQTYRNKSYIPNTLSFSLTKKSGEIFLCKSILRSQYRSFYMTYDNFVTFIVIHSMLHLKGMAHGSTMERTEKKLLLHFASTPLSTNETNHLSRH